MISHSCTGYCGLCDPSLTFAEAMALDPSEVEVWAKGDWEPLLRRPDHPTGDWVLSFLRVAKFRRSRPKRSRVEAMAAEWRLGSDAHDTLRAFGAWAIRAVCEYLRERVRTSPPSGPHFAEEIERHFLEPR